MGANGAYDLTPETEPAAIAAAQLAAVREAAGRLGPGATPEQISQEAVLPVWNVRRLLGLA